MDNNINNQPVSEVPMNSKKGNSAMWVIMIILVVVVAGVYLYIRNQGSLGIPTSTPTTSSSLNSLNSDLNSADTTGNNSELNQLDRDLQAL